MTRIMIIRHGEKHNGGHDRGVSIDGLHTKHELTVRGWQRAGALVRFFAPVGGMAQGSAISTPRSIFASAPTPQSPSLRPTHTVKLLAELLEIGINNHHACGDEAGLAGAVLAAASPVLIAWHHSHIRDIVAAITGGTVACPEQWPEDRFDVVWVLDRDEGGPWRFTQVPQQLFANDRVEVI
jgi:hypothetical protein